MKTCPVCKARAFDDMDICYGCMHRFTSDGQQDESLLGENEISVSEPRMLEEKEKSLQQNSSLHRNAVKLLSNISLEKGEKVTQSCENLSSDFVHEKMLGSSENVPPCKIIPSAENGWVLQFEIPASRDASYSLTVRLEPSFSPCEA